MKSLKYICSLLLAILFITACTDSFEGMNTEDGVYTPDKQTMDDAANIMYFNTIQRSIYFNDPSAGGTDWTFQIMQNLNVDMFSGYFHDMASQFADMNSTYNLNDGWNSSNWTYTYQIGVSAINKSMNVNEENKHFLALTMIYKVAMMHRLVDQYGSILYTDFENFVPDSQKDTYIAMFADIDKALTLLDEAKKEGVDDDIVKRFDILMQQDKTLSHYAKWANSLRLRLAMRISNVDAALAATEAKKALFDSHGLLETNADNVAVTADGSNYKNPLGTIGSWAEVYMNASMESFLVGYNDPRTEKYFNQSVGGMEGVHEDFAYDLRFPYAGMYKGIPQGFNYNIPDKCQHYINHSRSTMQITTDAPLMTSAEVWFLRAEAALRGFSTENVKQCYENGVQLSFEQWGANGVDTYLASDAQPSDYKDVFFEANDMKAVSTITPKWNESADNEEKLERIITQKWLAIYPEGAEAWAEQRRTGYPKLFKVLTNHSPQGTIDTEVMIRRLPFPSDLSSSQQALYDQLVQALNGADNGGTRLWWDVGQNNF